ncbi:ZIP family metal transporter [Aerococcus sanguinicola]|uniref:ZIP family metal transporter n=1 Tax=unclassified Aerococcus TaxID=2618060 RepID=UPI0008A432F7|nr:MULTISPECIES: ZIP family metal transporter [unclassified Aerococcus]KAB0647935.1 ZIP family metal transporter [Aerococcus sanguinicola]MDK6233431.1 ZIP family metal transporter [Aerococcus sp. UMB10185]MDK6855586.1 ZIP family metal transporter [Aerococcus sp. UMB7533]MDK8502305.1 ZIP family metal transporter [Aerococcus sp. UMB1112A]OFN02317.1 dihydroorotate dehydrogenase [Aerococcus sp. HMSC062A02]
MFDFFLNLHPVVQAGLAGIVTWFFTALGSSLVFFMGEINRKLLDAMNGFAAGVMIAASFWSLLAPSIEYAEAGGYGKWSFFPALVGFVAGGLFLSLLDKIIPHMHMDKTRSEAEGVPTQLSSTFLLFLAITIHNIPEGLSVGVAYGAVGSGLANASMASAISLTLGIALQNFPEGSALAMPIRANGNSRWRAFNLGQASALVEIVGAILGAWLVTQMTVILPYALAFAAGAMIFVCVEELIPESQSNGNEDLATLALIAGFAVMMVLDVALG